MERACLQVVYPYGREKKQTFAHHRPTHTPHPSCLSSPDKRAGDKQHNTDSGSASVSEEAVTSGTLGLRMEQQHPSN
ncbi:hypothetical protein NQZ68_033847 [Dissostichus eleginoides]|nr:hypothetical protein NQZ68_033847 [Dissostichus eleginoides]